jgi:hypothetical protein
MPCHTCPVCGSVEEFAAERAGQVYSCPCGERLRLPFARPPVRRSCLRPSWRGPARACLVGLAVIGTLFTGIQVGSAVARLPARDGDLTRRFQLVREEQAALVQLYRDSQALARRQMLTRLELEQLLKELAKARLAKSADPKHLEELARRRDALTRTLDRLADQYDLAREEYCRRRLRLSECLRQWDRLHPGQFKPVEQELDAAM